jgi:PAS domain S-box-containing protein
MDFAQQITTDILDSLSEGIFTVDKDFRINFINKAAEDMLGYQRDEVLGQFCKNVFRSQTCSTSCPIATVLEKGRPLSKQFSKLRHQNGQSLNIRLNAAVLKNSNGKAAGGVISFSDVSELEVLKHDLSGGNIYHGVVGHSKVMREIFSLIDEITDSDAAVMIQGPSGTGKEMIANAIQASSKRADAPFIKINCSVFSPQLLASELFGHVKGAFTGANRDRPGRFEIADKGTVFLDEVAEMPLQMQLQLLRVIQEGTFERVGESQTRKSDVRIIAATNIDLEIALREGRFREDLYYRLNVIPITIPALRERPDDIPHLVEHFIGKYRALYQRQITGIEDEALDLLLTYEWPGNIRELENAIQYAFARTLESDSLAACKFPPAVRRNYDCHENGNHNGNIGSERARILELLEAYHWNRSQVAKALGIGRTTLWRKLQKYELIDK